MSEQENKQLVQRGYDAFAAGDIETVMSLFDDDVEWVQPGHSVVSGTFHGKTELMEYMGRIAQKTPTINVLEMIAEGDRVCVLTEVTVDGQTSRDADVYRIRDGKTTEVRIHGDTALMEQIYGRKELAAG